MRIHVRLFAALVLALVVSGACKNPSGPSPTPTPTPPPPAVRSVTVVYSGPVPNYAQEPDISPIITLGRFGSSGQFIGFMVCRNAPPTSTLVPIKFMNQGNKWACDFLINEGEEVLLSVGDSPRAQAEGASSGGYTATLQLTNAIVIGGPFVDAPTGRPFLKVKVQ